MRSEQEIREALAGWEEELETCHGDLYPYTVVRVHERIAALRWVLAGRKTNDR